MKRFLIFLFSVGLFLTLLVSLSPARGIVWDWSRISTQGILIKLMVAGALACFVPKNRDRVSYASLSFLIGIVMGSVGLFFIKAIYIQGMYRWPFEVFSLAIPEIGSAFWHTARLNPLFASCLIPIGLMSAFISQPKLKWYSLGVAVGTTAFLIVATFSSPSVVWFGQGLWAQLYLITNAVVCAIVTRTFFAVATEI